MPASIHVSADGKIAAVHQHSSKIEAVALEPVSEDVDPSPLRRSAYSYCYERSFMKLYLTSLVAVRCLWARKPNNGEDMSRNAHTSGNALIGEDGPISGIDLCT